MERVREAVEYPFRGEDGRRRVIIGGILSFSASLLIPILFLYVYYADVFAATTQNKEPPKFHSIFQIGHVADKGLWVLAIIFTWISLIFVPIYAISAMVFGFEGLTAILTIMVGVYIYTIPVPLMFYGRTNSVVHAFHPDVLNIMISRDYIVEVSKVLIATFGFLIAIVGVLHYLVSNPENQLAVSMLISPFIIAGTFWFHNVVAYLLGTSVADQIDI